MYRNSPPTRQRYRRSAAGVGVTSRPSTGGRGGMGTSGVSPWLIIAILLLFPSAIPPLGIITIPLIFVFAFIHLVTA